MGKDAELIALLRRQFAENFLMARQRSGISQGELGRRINKARGDISKYECGRALPRLAMMVRLSRGLECPLEDLMLNMDPDDLAAVMGDLEEWTGNDGDAVYIDAIEERDAKRKRRRAAREAAEAKAPAKKASPAKKGPAVKKAPGAKKTPAAKKAPATKEPAPAKKGPAKRAPAAKTAPAEKGPAAEKE